jgi:hypothetical protein
VRAHTVVCVGIDVFVTRLCDYNAPSPLISKFNLTVR